MPNEFFTADYWNNEYKTDFANRDALKKDNYFVVVTEVAMEPCCFSFTHVMNFESYEKMMGFIRFDVVRAALGDAFHFDFDKAMYGDIDSLVKNYRKNGALDDTMMTALALWEEFDGIMKLPEAEGLDRLYDFKDRFNSFFDTETESTHGFEIVKPDESFADFWESYFDLSAGSGSRMEFDDCGSDEDDGAFDGEEEEEFFDDYDENELKLVKEALETGNVSLLDEALMNHNG